MLEVCELTKRYGGSVVVDRVSFTIRPGEILGYLGPNGAGKSTTVKTLGHFSRATGFGRPFCAAGPVRRTVAGRGRYAVPARRGARNDPMKALRYE
jgi:ABC-type uncharacterized transport system ATPase subunit